MNKDQKINWAFFGSSDFSVIVLNKLESLGLVPQLIVTTPDKPKGRGLKIEGNVVKSWAEKREIAVFAPASLSVAKNPETLAELKNLGPWDVFLIASYGKIVPLDILNIPKHSTLNIHPSLLPKFRGPTPLESAILDSNLDKTGTGVTIMKVDEQVDHGPIVAQKTVSTDTFTDWPPYYKNLEKILAEKGATLFAEILPKWIKGEIEAKEQNHAEATFTKKFDKSELQIDVTDQNQAEQNLHKIRAFSDNRGAYFLQKTNDREIRVIVSKAKIENGTLVLERVKPEGKKDMGYEDFKRGLR